MKTFFAAVFCAPFLSWAATAAVGGRIPQPPLTWTGAIRLTAK
jgi:hypothetical protein